MGVWEGIRVYDGRIFCLDQHLDRLFASAKTMLFKGIPSRYEVKKAIFETLEANGQRDETHIRLTLSRGLKTTSGMDPKLNQFGCTLIVLAEWKKPIYPDTGISLVCSNIRRNSPEFLDSKIHHNNLINNILAKIESNLAGADDALMLDQNGFIAETNATNVFLIKNGVVHTPLPDACLPGITRKTVIALCHQLDIPIQVRNISLSECYQADSFFTTGTMGELSPVNKIDGREIENLSSCDTLEKIQVAFRNLTEKDGEVLPF